MGSVRYLSTFAGDSAELCDPFFSGELNGLIDSVELLLVIQMCLHQVWMPGGSSEKAIDIARQLELGTRTPKAEAVVDARSVFDCLAATDAGELVEGSLKLHVLALRERSLAGTRSALWWTDTRDMLADGENFSDNAEGEARSGCAFIMATAPYRPFADSYFYFVW